jgi:hypothetical protein
MRRGGVQTEAEPGVCIETYAQAVAPAAENWPAAHASHGVPPASEKVPPGQKEQLAPPAALAALYMPAAQHWPDKQSGEQVEAPRCLFTIPQDTLGPLQEQVGRGTSEDGAVHWPGWPQLPASPAWVVLRHQVAFSQAAQAAGLKAPSVGECVPAGQSKQEDTPAHAGSVCSLQNHEPFALLGALAWYLPGGHHEQLAFSPLRHLLPPYPS